MSYSPYLIDASSLMLLLKNGEETRTVEVLGQSRILDLTFYEFGNAIWKEASLSKYIMKEDVENLTVLCSISVFLA